MKRIEALQPLSHQHHNALMGSLLIKKGVSKKAEKKVLKDFLLQLWNQDIQRHMQTEEEILLPMIARSERQFDSIIKRDHETLRLLADRIRIHEDGYTPFEVFADLLEQHIRFEERVVFAKIQENLSDEQLQKLSDSFSALSSRKCQDYPVKFWE